MFIAMSMEHEACQAHRSLWGKNNEEISKNHPRSGSKLSKGRMRRARKALWAWWPNNYTYRSIL
jgi:hypothetical protein